ncbi:hypothetical protein [Nonomuraea sp. B1E8]|uniref:hypothetical protein n=1 Tax=unclassified Nonomuraea TaxID=2593643 RepID=UPI00325CA552
MARSRLVVDPPLVTAVPGPRSRRRWPSLAKLRFRGAKLLLGLFLATLVLPGEVTIISQYVTVRSLGLADTLLGWRCRARSGCLTCC